MKTPAGKECRYFFGDYFRGRSHEECRLLASSTPPLKWIKDFCFTCPVPEILLANACDHLILEPRLERPFPFTKQKVTVVAYCDQSNRRGFDPHIGCGECHPLPMAFFGENS
jgi:hypothetical protein